MSRLPFQIAAIVFVAFALFFIWDFSQRVVTNMRLSQVEKQLDQQVAQAQATHDALIDQKKRVQTDTYVEEVFRPRHWIRPNETAIVPLITPAAPSAAPSNAIPSASSTVEKPWWQDLFDFLFGL